MNLLQRSICLVFAATALEAFADERSSLPDPRTALGGMELVEALKRGGLTLYFRHGATDRSQIDRPDLDLADCSTQRNLSDVGRGDARAIGEAMRALGLLIDEVLASPYCRTMDTARLITGRATASRAVLGMMTTTGGTDYSQLDAILSTAPHRGTLRVIASHGNPLHALAGDPELAEGEVAVVRSEGKGWKIVARLPAAQWAVLSRGVSPADAGNAPKRSGPN
jgi:phosphohistidine phosphatase SixA